MTNAIIIKSESSFSTCGLYRWCLKREYNTGKNKIVFIGLNPSKASSLFDDNTVRRLLSFSISWNYSSLVVLNLFARVSTCPSLIKKCADPIGYKNNHEISQFAIEWSNDPYCDLWLGWGNNGSWLNRNFDVIDLLKPFSIIRLRNHPNALGPLCLGLTRRGHPRHPLYAPGKTTLKPFKLA